MLDNRNVAAVGFKANVFEKYALMGFTGASMWVSNEHKLKMTETENVSFWCKMLMEIGVAGRGAKAEVGGAGRSAVGVYPSLVLCQLLHYAMYGDMLLPLEEMFNKVCKVFVSQIIVALKQDFRDFRTLRKSWKRLESST